MKEEREGAERGGERRRQDRRRGEGVEQEGGERKKGAYGEEVERGGCWWTSLEQPRQKRPGGKMVTWLGARRHTSNRRHQ